jgi:hypothetical protein
MRISKFRLMILKWLLRDRAVYDICCALRGPDNRDEDLKAATTAVIRHRLGINREFCIVYPDIEFRVKQRNIASSEATANEAHFLRHAEDAFRKLGLHWLDVNE